MSNLSNELFFTVHRGLTQTPAKGKGLGMHWSLDPKVAETSARQWPKKDVHGTKGSPTTISAQVPLSSVETDTEKLNKSGVYTDPRDFHMEKEVAVKPGAPIKVTAVTKHNFSRSRTRTYNPPREMKA